MSNPCAIAFDVEDAGVTLEMYPTREIGLAVVREWITERVNEQLASIQHQPVKKLRELVEAPLTEHKAAIDAATDDELLFWYQNLDVEEKEFLFGDNYFIFEELPATPIIPPSELPWKSLQSGREVAEIGRFRLYVEAKQNTDVQWNVSAALPGIGEWPLTHNHTERSNEAAREGAAQALHTILTDALKALHAE